MMTIDMQRKIARRQFDPPADATNNARRWLGVDIARLYALADEGHDAGTIAERIGMSKQSVKYRITKRQRAAV